MVKVLNFLLCSIHISDASKTYLFLWGWGIKASMRSWGVVYIVDAQNRGGNILASDIQHSKKGPTGIGGCLVDGMLYCKQNIDIL